MKKTIFILSLFILILVVGCRIDTPSEEPSKEPTIVEPTPTLTPTPTPEVELVDIYVKNTEELYCNVGEPFKTTKLSVIAKYSDGSEVNVTEQSTFSTVLTNTVGQKELTISFEEKTIIVLVNILKPIGLEVDTAQAKTKYEIGDVIDISGLKVYNAYENQEKKACITYIIRIENQNGEYIPVNSVFETEGIYDINVVSGDFIKKYEITVGDVSDVTPTPEQGLYTVTFLVNTSEGIKKYEREVYEDSKPEDFIIEVEGYMFLGFSYPFDEWEARETVNIVNATIKEGKYILGFVGHEYVYHNHLEYDLNSVVERENYPGGPNYYPEGMKFHYWDLPRSFNITKNMLVEAVYIPSDMDISKITEEDTVNNVSANAIDVNVEEFVYATPEGYELDSITLSLNGEIIEEIPYEEGMVSAYFTELTNNTEYEVGADYVKEALALARINYKELPGFHYSAFSILTCGDVKYRLVFTYNGEYLHRWYIAEGTKITSNSGLFNFELPEKYRNYKCAGAKVDLNSIKTDSIIEVVLVSPADEKCTVVFYAEDKMTILKVEEVDLQHSATAPTIKESYYSEDGVYKYTFNGWSESFDVVLNNLYLYPKYYGEIVGEEVAKETVYAGNGFTYFEIEFNEIYKIRNYIIEVKYYNENTNKETLISGNANVIHDDYFRYETHMLNETPRETVAIFDLHYRYTLSDGRGEQNYVKRITVDTMKPCISPGYVIEYNVTHNKITPKSEQQIQAYFYNKYETFSYALYTENSVFTPDTEYQIHYAVPSGESDNLYYVYANRFETVTTLSAPLFTVHMGYSGYHGEWEEFELDVYEDSKPEDFIKTEVGYFFLGFSTPFDEWENEFVKIYVEQIESGKCIVSYVTDDYVHLGTKEVNVNSVINKNDMNCQGRIPEGMKFAYWDMPNTLTVTENMYIKAVFVPQDLDTTNLTEEATVNNVSANAIDVNVDEFVKATPEGYVLDSITLSLNGEIIEEIPYEDGMISAYFTDLTVDTEYEVGAYYAKIEGSTLTNRRARELTYRFHFVGFIIVTRGDVLYRVRMMYNGDCLYRWYFAEGTKPWDSPGFYSFYLPIEYEGYRCAGSLTKLSEITEDTDVEVILVGAVEDTCTVIFYDYDGFSILDMQEIEIGGSVTAPTVIDHYFNTEMTIRYNFTGWSASLENITTNLFLYPRYSSEMLVPPTITPNIFVGDGFIYMYIGSSSYTRSISYYKVSYVAETNGSIIKTDYLEYDSFEGKVQKFKDVPTNAKITLKYEYRYELNDGLGVQEVSEECVFNTVDLIENPGYIIEVSSVNHYDFYFIKNENIVKYFVKESGTSNDLELYSRPYVQNTEYSVYYSIMSDVENVNYIIPKEFKFTTKDVSAPVIEEIRVKFNENHSTALIQLKYQDVDNIIENFEARIEFNETMFDPMRSMLLQPWYNKNTGYYEAFLPLHHDVVDPDTGEEVTYIAYLSAIEIYYTYDGKYRGIHAQYDHVEGEYVYYSSFDINASSLVGLEAYTNAVKTAFYPGEEFNYDKLLVKAIKGDGTKVTIPSKDLEVELVGGSFNDFGTYTIKVTYVGHQNILNKETTYTVTYKKPTIEFGYSGVMADFFEVDFVSTNPADYLSAPNGYYATHFSNSFEEWVPGSFVKIYVSEITNGKVPLVLLEADCSELPTVIWYTPGSEVDLSDVSAVPNVIPEGMEFSHWRLPNTFTMSAPVYASPVFVPAGFNAEDITEEVTVNNVSANAIDVDVEEFINAAPEGYSLDSITLGLNGVIVAEIPYEEGMVSAYFTDLTENTEYEVGAYYNQNQATTLGFRRNKQLTYRYHFVGFMIVTKGDVLYRVRMMYQGDCLYRWYYSPNSYVSNDHFFYDFQLPIEYDGYKCKGTTQFVGYITSDMDLEVVMVKVEDELCTVVFYTEDYRYGDRTILKEETVPKGGSATPPVVQDYDDGRFIYIFDGWSGTYKNVTKDEDVYATFIKRPMFVPRVEIRLIIFDDSIEVLINSISDVGDSDIFINCNVDGNDFWANRIEHLYGGTRVYIDGLSPDTQYRIYFDFFFDMVDHIDVESNINNFSFRTRKGTETSGKTFNVTATSYSYSVNEYYSGQDTFRLYKCDENGNNGVRTTSGTLCQNSYYYLNPIMQGEDYFISYEYYDKVLFKTLDAVEPSYTITNIDLSGGKLKVEGEMSDPSNIIRYIELTYKVTDNSNYITESCKLDKTSGSVKFSVEIDLSAVDPVTGITHYYQVSYAELTARCYYNGSSTYDVDHNFNIAI